ncbi:MAG: 3-oxoacyl-[acyl-carrier-protein] synthase III C-terminal domain-containing protein [Thermoanaerobaculia bacterium]|nr:3-oxoacyl-[acyl-carrier-protein] synthase III C-terminal domain-containing protein [Thermoanaerobaculia bacterium]
MLPPTSLVERPASAGLPVRILGTGVHVPSRCVTSAELDATYGRVPGTTAARSGVVTRFWAGPEESSVSMAAAALGAALEAAGMAATELDAVIVASVLPEQPMPTNAVLVLGALGVPGGGVAAFDINASCLGFLTALDVASLGIAAGRWRHVGIVASELASKGLNHGDIESSALFGDGAGAAVLGPGGESSCLLASRFETHPRGARLCEIAAGGTRFNVVTPPADPAAYLFRMDGLGIMKLAAETLPPFLAAVLAEAGLGLDDLDVVVPHQASHLGLRFLRERLGVPADKVVDQLATHGNQVSASLGTAFHAAIASGRLHRGGHVLLIGTAAGLSLGAAILRY